MLVIEDVSKSYGQTPVLDGVNLAVPAGRIMGLIGSNGAGKTTLISIAAGLITADAGTVRVGEGRSASVDVASDRRRAAGLVGLAPQELGVYPMLSVRQNLVTFAELAGMGKRATRERVDAVVDALDLAPQLAQRADTLSGGQARRLHTAMALMHRPAVLFLDEPTVGADVAARGAILDVVKELAREGASVIYTTHYLGEVSDLGADVAILHGGSILLTGSVKEVVDAHAAPSVSVVTAGVPPSLPGWRPSPLEGGHTRWDAPVESRTANPTAVLADALSRLGAGTTLEAVDVTPASLESAFLAVTGQRLSAEEVPDVAHA
ncbi:ABC transporter ATP-binding protein [Demequina sp.]|uniref:ABC transporter ATP-binding protein n=1 Tax=Demequina sp. TaxID=2050685 RepID=UPI0025BA33F5|nr:ABC transporter ATP-binding protein [Demequina sp.]